MSDTPRTDAKAKSSYNPTFSKPDVVEADFARTLERELNAEVEKAITQNDKLIAERDQLRAELQRIRAWGIRRDDEMQHQAKLALEARGERDAWREMARDLAKELTDNIAPGIESPALDHFNTMECNPTSTPPVTQEMACVVCSHIQTFSGVLVSDGKAEGICDNCGQQREWQEIKP